MKNSTKKFKYLEHTADIKFQAFGNTIEQAFSNSALAMFNSMSDISNIKGKIKKQIKVQGHDYEALLYNFLEELLFLFDIEHFFLVKVKNIKIKKINKDKKYGLSAEVLGDDAKNYEIHIDIKAITYNEMFVKQDKKTNKWATQVVLDV